MLQFVLAAVAAAVMVLEGAYLLQLGRFDRARVISILATRYFCWRAVFNTLLYVSVYTGATPFDEMAESKTVKEQEDAIKREKKLLLQFMNRQDRDPYDFSTYKKDRLRAQAASQPVAAAGQLGQDNWDWTTWFNKASGYSSIMARVLIFSPMAQMGMSFALLFDVALGFVLHAWIFVMAVGVNILPWPVHDIFDILRERTLVQMLMLKFWHLLWGKLSGRRKQRDVAIEMRDAV